MEDQRRQWQRGALIKEKKKKKKIVRDREERVKRDERQRAEREGKGELSM